MTVTERHLIAYGLIAFLLLGLAGIVWWSRYKSHKQTHGRQLAKQQKKSAARSLALMSASYGDSPS